MNNKSSCYPADLPRAINLRRLCIIASVFVCVLALSRGARAADAPQWMHAVVSAPLPAHDDKTDAVLLYSERSVNVQSVDKIKVRVREVYKILRPSGRD